VSLGWFLAGRSAASWPLSVLRRPGGQRLQSRLLLADAMHTTSDNLDHRRWCWSASVAPLAGLNWLEIWRWRSHWACLLVRACWQVSTELALGWWKIRSSIAPEAIHSVANGGAGVLNCHDIASRGVIGQQVFIDMHMVGRPTIYPPPSGPRNWSKSTWKAPLRPGALHHSPRGHGNMPVPEITFRGTHMVESLTRELACL